MDLRGCGLSGRGPELYSLELLAGDAVALLDATGVSNCHLVGHSLGGVVAQEILTRYNSRVSSAVLVATSSKVSDKASRNWLRLADRVEASGIQDSEAGRRRPFSPSFAESHPEVVNYHAQLVAESDAAVYAEQARVAAGYDYSSSLATVVQPVLVMQGLDDRLTSPGGSVLLSRALPESTLEMIPGVGHQLPAEMGRQFVDRLLEFFPA
jgi:3-oxoadipate enol-lactonase